MKTNKQKLFKRFLKALAIIFIIMNVIAIFHAYKFTHFSTEAQDKVIADKLTPAQKARVLFFGVNNPRPINTKKPSGPYETVTLQSNKKIECWIIKVKNAKGTVVLFHGYQGDKSKLIGESDTFTALGYNTMLVDFMGSGGSEGNQTTIGFKEAEQVKTCFDYISKTEKSIYLCGNSMGAVAILKAVADYGVKPKAIIIGCPFGTMYNTVCARFDIMGVPKFPMAGLLMFWGGTTNGFWAFGHNPDEYAKAVKCPVLLCYGQKDNRVSRAEIDTIYANLNGKKTLKVYADAGHDFLEDSKNTWPGDIALFLNKINSL